MPAAIPIAIAASSAGSSLIGAKMAGNASKDAARIQSDASKQAVRRQDAATQQALSYYGQAQGKANPARDKLGAMMRLPPRQMPQQQPQGLPMGGGVVTIQAPTGEQRQVPASQAQKYVQQGGRVVQ